MMMPALLVLPLLAPILTVADGPPKFDVAATCKHAVESGQGIGRPAAACEADENQARATITQRWQSYPVAARTRCVEETRLGGPPSYVEVMTCLEMAPRR
jgi:hypothetical protein